MNSKYRIVNISQHKAAKVVGFSYLLTIVTGVFTEFYVRNSLYVSGNATATANNITASEGLFRMGILSELIAFSSVGLLAWSLYILLKPVSKNLALLALFWRLVETSVYGIITINSFIVLLLLSGADYLAVFETDQLHTLVMLFIKTQSVGYSIGMIFFGLGSTIFTYLLFKSNYVPKILAALGICASLLVLFGTFAMVLFPKLGVVFYPWGFLPIFIFELTLGFWLLIKGASLPETKS